MKIPEHIIKLKKEWCCGGEIKDGQLCGEPCFLEGYYYICERCWGRI